MLTSFHLSCNSASAKLKMMLSQADEQISEVGGQSSVIIPAVYLKNLNNSPTNSSSSLKDQKSLSKASSRVKSASKSRLSVSSSTNLNEKYVLEGYCTSDWTLTPGEEAWVEKLRQEEELEMRVFGPKGDLDASKKNEKKRSTSKVNSPDSGVEEKASWMLKVFVESDQADGISMKIDTSRKETVRAMKLAWESAEPGRNEKGQESREAYLASFDEQNPMPTVEELIKKTKKGTRGEEPELLIANFTRRRREFEEYR